MQQRGHEPHDVAHFLNKIIFCLFAEDAKGPASDPLLPDQIFSKILHNGRKDVVRCQAQIKKLFSAMANRHGDFGEHIIQWFNGGLFDDDLTLPLNADDIDKLLNVSLLDWSAIEPSIFGTLFERGLDPNKRSQLGAHYTDPVSIMRIVNPVIVEPLLAEWAVEKAAIGAQMDVFHRFETSKKPSEKAKGTSALKDAFRRYIAFKEKLKNFKVLDPACGSGNFLYLALQSLKDIELRIDLEAESLGLERGFPEVGPQSMFGIELSPYAAELAKVTVWIGDIQWMLKHGFAPSKEPVLKKLDGIQCRDALVTYPRKEAEDTWRSTLNRAGQLDVTSRKDFELLSESARAEWPKVDVIIGNPPFLGIRYQIAELGEGYVTDLRQAFKGTLSPGSDLVCYWFEQAHAAMKAGNAIRAGLVATNSIRSGASRGVLEKIVDLAQIYSAWSDEPWVNDGAAVRVSIVCFALKSDSEAVVLDGRKVKRIDPDLSAELHPNAPQSSDLQSNLTHSRALVENENIAFQGILQVGEFDITGEQARAWLTAPNPHNRSNSEVLRRGVNGLDIVRRNRDFWLIDFGVSGTEHDASLFELPFQYLLERVKPIRETVRREGHRQYWWRFGEARPGLRRAIAGLDRYLVTPWVSKHLVFTFVSERTLPYSATPAVAKADDVSFGILSSCMHVSWALRIGSTLEDRPRYTTNCFETFPFPEGLTPNLKPEKYTNLHVADIAAAAKRLNELRENWLNPPDWVIVVPEVVPGYSDRIIPKPEYSQEIKRRTLTNLYNLREEGKVQWLEDAHRALDAAVARAYGWDDYTPEMPVEEILRRLLKLNLERAAAGR